MLDGEIVFPVVGQALVESSVLLSGDVWRVTSPDGLGLVELVVDSLGLLDLLFLLLFLFILILDFLDLRLLTRLDFLFVVFDLLDKILIRSLFTLGSRTNEPFRPPWSRPTEWGRK